jgi:hypothetical protein
MNYKRPHAARWYKHSKKQTDDSCYNFMLITTEGQEDTFAWDRIELWEIIDSKDQSDKD